MNLLPEPHILALTRDLLDEALSDSGTWRLSTYNQLQVSAASFSQLDANYLVRTIMTTLLSEDTPANSKYKIAQLASYLAKLELFVFGPGFLPFQVQLMAAYAKMEEDSELGPPTVKLLRSIFEEQPAKKGAPRPSVTRLRGSGRMFVSRTPQPRNLPQVAGCNGLPPKIDHPGSS
jgi:hypothetical protein